MIKKLLLLIALTLVLGVFDTTMAMDSVDHSSNINTQKSVNSDLKHKYEEELNNKQIEIIIKNRKNHNEDDKKNNLNTETV